ncbi:hypothetical protein ABL78_0123 [Leptomonas seymouri]|uniref:REH2 DRSM domain-containing protein n=1 Tax=Leptomonas seymouri TaxID=5684 RepID=A0A0N0P9G1_LEPSE|nr:hypothetical protein ABL78_0123 [Leptomonas seymouri]|eukprot:KPI90687.1 hypothetical protein ABL78_0123 [Leptomonas seymouri]
MKRWSRLSCGCDWAAWIAPPHSNTKSFTAPSWSARRARAVFSVFPHQQGASSLCYSQRHYVTSSSYTTQQRSHSSAMPEDADDWSTIEVEVLKPEAVPASSSCTLHTTAETITRVETAHSSASPSTNTEAVQTIHAIDAYAKAKVMNFIRRQQQLPQGGGAAVSSSAASGGRSGSSGSCSGENGAASSSSSNTSIPGMEVREVQGAEGDSTQFHARWRLPLPTEYGERFGEGFAPTAKEAENVAAMHAERVIDALGFPLFLLSSKQRKHAEAARAAGRWAPMPVASTSGPASTVAEIVPPPETLSPPPLRLQHISARERQERQLHIDHVRFTPVEKGAFAPLSCTLTSPYFYDPASVRRIDAFLKVQRALLSRCLRFISLQRNHMSAAQQSRESHPPAQSNLFLAQLTLPLPPQFGIRVAMGRGPTKKDAATLACMHAELIIDAVGFALYPTNHKLQAVHAEECARVRRWCASPGDFNYRYSAVSPAPLELVEKLDESAAAAAASFGPVGHEGRRDDNVAGQRDRDTLKPGGKSCNGAGDDHHASKGLHTDSADIQVGTASSDSVESILLQHHHAIAAASRFSNEVSMRDYDNARLLLERYLEQFVGLASPASSSNPPSSELSPLRSLMFVEMLGQRDRPSYRATITVPLVEVAEQAGSTPTPAISNDSSVKPPLPYTQSFVAIGVSDAPHIAELAASLHALRTLASLNRLTLLRGNPAIIQAMESFAARGHLPLYNPALPMLSPATVSPEELPAAVRVMEGVIGRIAASGLSAKTKEARAQVFSPGVLVQPKKNIVRDTNSKVFRNILHRHMREDFLLKELQLARSRVPRLDWDTTADAQNRIVVAPDADPRTARQYFHTLSSVRNPDNEAALRIRDYLERHGKTRDMVSTTTRVRVSKEAPEEGYMFVTTLTLPLPELSRRHTREEEDAAAGGERERGIGAVSQEGEATPTPPISAQIPSSLAFPPAADSICHAEMKTLTAQGEAPTREDSVLLCDAHAELLLDALGVPLYDHPQLQCKHADTARALGRWAPLVRGALMAPASLRPFPPPLRKVTRESALWASVQRERCAAEAKARKEDSNCLGGAAAAADATVRALASTDGGDATAGGINDEALCNIARLRFVHPTEMFHNSVRYAVKYFTEKGLDFYRAVRQYKVSHPKYGVVHRAIVELPTPPMYGKRYAVGVADTKRGAFHLCSQHTVHILDHLNIPVHHTKAAQSRYAHRGAIKGQRVPLLSDGRAGANTPTPPGYYSLELSEAASEPPPVVPVCPTAEAAEEELVWKTYVRRCAAYRTRWATYVEKKALSAVPMPSAPRLQVPVEDAMLDIAESLPLEQQAGRLLREACSSAGLPNPLTDRVSFSNVKLAAGKRVFSTACPLYGTPYTMRGASGESGPESRLRAYMHGIQLVQCVARANSEIGVTARCAWAEGVYRHISVLDSLKGEITHHGRVWVLRMWSAMHSPPRALQVAVREESTTSCGAASAKDSPAAAGKALRASEEEEASPTETATPSFHGEDNNVFPAAVDGEQVELNLPLYHASVSIVECRREGVPKVVLKEVCVAAGLNGTAAVQGAVHRVFFHLQRTPTMQALHRFLSRQPQLHLPSLRTLRDPDKVVDQAKRLLLPSVATPTPSATDATMAKCTQRAAVPFAIVPPSMLSSGGKVFWTSSIYSTWPVEILACWVRAHSGTEESAPPSVELPCTLAQTFAAYGLVAKDNSLCGGGGSRSSHIHGARDRPSRLAGALVLLCRCLPSPSPPLPDAAFTASNTFTQDRTLPLQLAHVLLMGLLLDCVLWAARLVAMVVHAEETLEWYTKARLAPRLTPSQSFPEASLQATRASSTLWRRMSVDVVEAVLLSADPASPPLPASVESYALAVSKRLSCLSIVPLSRAKDASANRTNAESVNVEGHHRRIDATWPQQEEAPLTEVKVENSGVSVPTKRLSVQETQVLRSLLQCAVVASAAPQEIWVRSGSMEDAVRNLYEDSEEDAGVDDANEAVDSEGDAAGGALTSETVFVFQGRRSAPFAALCVDGMDLTRVDADSRHALSSMATCFAAFGCAVEPSAETKSADPAAAGLLHAAAATEMENGGAERSGAGTHAQDGAEEAVAKEEEGEGGEVQAVSTHPAFFTRVLGTCVTPLAAMVAGQDTVLPFTAYSRCSSEATTGASALRLVDEDLPMLMTAFQGTVPLLVHDSKSASALQQLAVHFRSRIMHLSPFTETERRLLCQLFSLPVEAVGDDGIADV